MIEPLVRGDDCDRWLQRFTAAAAWHELRDARLKNAFLASVGPEAFASLADACLPAKLADMSFAQLEELLRHQFQPKKLAIAARFDFSRLHQESDYVAAFVRRLRKSAIDCEFGDQTDDHIRDQFVFGLANKDALRKMLTLTLTELTLTKAISIAESFEAVQDNQSRWMEHSAGTSMIHRISNATCYCCGKRGHIRRNCRFRNERCLVCKQLGHLKIVCRASQNEDKQEIKMVTDSNPDSALNDDTVFSLGNGKFYKKVCINGINVLMRFDTGADVSLIDQETFNLINKNTPLRLQRSFANIRDYSGKAISIKGETKVAVKGEHGDKLLRVLVVHGKAPCIFGCDWIQSLQPSFAVNIVKDHTVSLTLKDNETPVFCKPRAIPYGLQAAVKTELDRLVEEGILSAVKESEWATPIVPIKKPSGQIRICGDYKVTLNHKLRNMVTTTPHALPSSPS